MEYEIKVQDLIEHIRFGTQIKYDIKDYVVAIGGLLDLYNKEKEKNKELLERLKYRVKYCGLLEGELYGNENIELTKIEQELLEERN